MHVILITFLFISSLFAQDLTQQLQNDLENFSDKMESYQESDQAIEWQERYDNKELQELREKYRRRKVKRACGTCPLNNFVMGVLKLRLNDLYQKKEINKKSGVF